MLCVYHISAIIRAIIQIRPLPEKLQEDVNRRMQLKIVPEGLMLNLFKLGLVHIHFY